MKTFRAWPLALRGRSSHGGRSLRACGRPVSLFATLMLLLAGAPLALAQTTSDTSDTTAPTTPKKPKKKKGAKPAPTAEPAPAPPPEPPPPPPPSDDETTKKPDKAATSAASENAPPEPATDTKEEAGKRYYFVGARYRVTVIPQFMVNLFANEGATFVSHTIGAELDMRKDGQSVIPWIAVQTFGFGDTIFEQKNGEGGDANPSNWSVVNSSLSALFIGLDEAWSVPLDKDHHVDFEYGFGFGLGVVFGTLKNDWVYDDGTGPLVSSAGRHFSQCTDANNVPPGTPGYQLSCTTNGHQNASVAKVGGYSESHGIGGPIPIIFPHVAIPQLGIRWKPVKQFEMRFNIGFSLTGFFLGIGGDVGTERPAKPGSPGAEGTPTTHDDTAPQ